MLTLTVVHIVSMWYHGYEDGDEMATSEAQKRAIAKWQQEKVEEIKFRVPKGTKAIIKEHADECGESVNAFLLRAAKETIKRDKAK